AVLVLDRNGHADDAVEVLLVVESKSAAANPCQLCLQLRQLGDRAWGVRLELATLQHAPALLRLELRQQSLAARRAMGTDAAAGGQVRAQRPLALDALQIDVFEVVEDAD